MAVTQSRHVGPALLRSFLHIALVYVVWNAHGEGTSGNSFMASLLVASRTGYLPSAIFRGAFNPAVALAFVSWICLGKHLIYLRPILLPLFCSCVFQLINPSQTTPIATDEPRNETPVDHGHRGTLVVNPGRCIQLLATMKL
jgi:hypothetical protein